MSFFVSVLLQCIRRKPFDRVTHITTTSTLSEFVAVADSLASKLMRLFRRRSWADHDTVLSGCGRPVFVCKTAVVTFLKVRGLVYRLLDMLFYSLLNHSSDVRWHMRIFLDRVACYETDAALLGIAKIGTKLVLGNGVLQCLLTDSSNSLKRFTRLSAFLLQATVSWRTWLRWWGWRRIRVSTFLYSHNRSIFHSCREYSRLMLVIVLFTSRCAFTIAFLSLIKETAYRAELCSFASICVSQ